MNGAVEFPLDVAELSFAASGDALVRRTVLPSGVRILSEHVPGSRSATLGYWVAVGSRDERGGETPGASESGYGSTHFLEHLLFKGTPTRTAFDIAIAFDSVGGEHNALTAKEHTCYYAKVRDHDLGMAVEVIADMLTSSLLDADEFENERGVILEELAMAEDDPGDVVSQRLFEAVLGDHALGRPIGGTPDAIRQVTRDAVLAHYRENYRPQDLVITAAGAVDHDALVAGVTTALTAAGWDLSATARPVERRHQGDSPVTRGAVLSVETRPIEQVHLLIGFPGLAAADDRRLTMGVLSSILGGGMSSRLFQEIREKRGLAYSVYSFSASYSDAGVFGLYGACSPARAREVADLMLDELRRLATDGITDDELARANGALSGASALALEDSDTRMSRLGRAEITLGEFLDLDESLRRLALVTTDDVQALAADLVARPLSLAAVGAVDDDVFAGFGEDNRSTS
ncbi:insulinase family protein [Mycetocola manganoxydans]|uniref:Insulinase family protein n=1 Tax=Mycetocola manganoxydans TaxID=699879 RepID=A0A3L6ZQ47_9MICO|nr:pitrilysin family protein [Mycetocola manganoxydans]RLP69785.1 insulinase family protein [Mycetocola manganoxydans]